MFCNLQMLKAHIDVESSAVLLLPFFCKVVKGGKKKPLRALTKNLVLKDWGSEKLLDDLIFS